MPSPSIKTWEGAVLWLRQQPESMDLVRACFYDDPLIDAARRYRASSEWTAVEALLPATPGRALDIGSGRGIAAYALAESGWQVTALEPDPSSVVGAGAIRELARASSRHIEIVETWGEELPFQDASFDVVHCRQVLHHARDLSQLCRQIGRVMKPGATFLATREHVISRPGDLPAFLRSHPLHSLYGGENAYLLGEYKSALTSAGIVLDQVLNPLQSDINTFPETLNGIRARLARKLGLPSPKLIPAALLAARGALSRTPGRLYSFVGHRAAAPQ